VTSWQTHKGSLISKSSSGTIGLLS
ncbi:hypothetical protein CCACVL1_04700, partial [Corchorus capsularis]